MFLTFLDAELLRIELLHSRSPPEPELQLGGAVSTRGIKRGNESKDETIETKVPKPEAVEPETDTTDEYGGGPDPLFVANIKKLGPAKSWKKKTVVNQKFIMTLEQPRGPKPDEDLNIGATHAIAVAVNKLAEENNIPEEYEMTLQIGSREHMKDGQTGESWKVPVGDFTKRAMFTQQMLNNVSRVLNSGEFISSDIGFSASVLFMRPETKGGKHSGYSPGQKIWEELAKELRCVCRIMNKVELCCARAIVTMPEYAKREKGESNTFENIRSG